MKSENFQAINSLLNRYRGKIKCIYIDPPYNTSDEGLIYKNNYKHSSWVSMMENRLALGQEFLSEDGVIQVAIAE